VKALDKVCSMLPEQLNATCREFVDKYVPAAIEMLKDADPQQVCGLLGLCSAKSMTAAG